MNQSQEPEKRITEKVYTVFAAGIRIIGPEKVGGVLVQNGMKKRGKRVTEKKWYQISVVYERLPADTEELVDKFFDLVEDYFCPPETRTEPVNEHICPRLFTVSGRDVTKEMQEETL